jgi:hypothetical protein
MNDTHIPAVGLFSTQYVADYAYDTPAPYLPNHHFRVRLTVRRDGTAFPQHHVPGFAKPLPPK